jgi:hypothetical protein
MAFLLSEPVSFQGKISSKGGSLYLALGNWVCNVFTQKRISEHIEIKTKKVYWYSKAK